MFKDLEVIDEIIRDIELAINGDFDEIDDPDVTNELGIAFITSTNIEYYYRDGDNILGNCSKPAGRF